MLFWLTEKLESRTPEAGARTAHLTHFLLVATVVAIASFLVRTITDPDTWWQVAIGRDILADLTVPRIDHFAAASFGRSYHDSHWLFQTIVALADHVGEMKGVALVMIALWGATFLCCYRAVRHWVSPSAACLLVFTVAIACSDRFTPRPDLVTCLMIALFYLQLQAGRYRTIPHLALLGLLQVIWSNSHGLFVIGPFMAGCYLAAALVRRVQGKENDLPATATLLIVLLVATLVTPFGFDGWRYALLLMKEAGPGSSALFKSLAELTPTFGAKMRSEPDFWFNAALVAGFVITSVPALLKRQMPLHRLMIVTLLFVASATGRRNIPLFALTAAPLIAENMCRSSARFSFPAALKAFLAIALLAASYLPLSGKYYEIFRYQPARFGLGAAPELFPPGLPAFMQKVRFAGNLYNTNSLGGFCLYHGFLPLTDGRWEAYEEKVLNRIMKAPFAESEWEWLVAAYDIRGVVLLNGEEETITLFPLLTKNGRFNLVYSDHTSSFWMKTDH